MEETNYDRLPIEAIEPTTAETDPASDSTDPEKSIAASVTGAGTPTVHSTEEGIVYTPKTYLQKLKVWDKKRPFNLFRMMTRPLIFLSFPVIVYAGFTYGCNLIWFNTLNATASLILGGAPYNFSP